MYFISYAQNWEDVMLFRALKQVKQGCYIDVGACDPVTHSVTKAFYDRGWCGINIEPVSHWYEQLCTARPGDVNIQALAWSRRGQVSFYEVRSRGEGNHTGLSTTDRRQAMLYKDSGYAVTEHAVVTLPLSQVIEHYNVTEVHFLKIDVEGAEASVLRGIDFSSVKPWIVIAEATRPLTTVETWSEWEPVLQEQGYSMCYFDGVNRFYLSEEHAELRDSFRVPPNSFDDFKTYMEHKMLQHMRECPCEI